jgi:hypothetical protein
MARFAHRRMIGNRPYDPLGVFLAKINPESTDISKF